MKQYDPFDEQQFKKTLRRYQRRQKDFRFLAEHVMKQIGLAATRLGFYPIMSCRPKSLQSFAEKLQRPGKDYKSDPLLEAGDLAGVRVILHFPEQVVRLNKELRLIFAVDEQTSEDKKEALLPNEFGYLSTHVTVKLKRSRHEEGLSDRDYKRVEGLKCEVQLRTICQHGWADVYHEAGYKSEFTLPNRWQREFATVAAMLEKCDDIFQQIQTQLASFESSYKGFLDKPSLERLAKRLQWLLDVMKEKSPGRALSDRLPLVQTAHRLVRTLLALERGKELEELLAEYEDDLADYPPALRDFGVAYTQVCRNKPRSRNFLKGQMLLKRALELEPNDSDAWCSLGGSYRRQNKHKQATECYREGHRCDPEDSYALVNYVMEELHHGIGRDIIEVAYGLASKAIARCQRQIEAKINFPWALYDLGTLHLLREEGETALCWYARGIEHSTAGWEIESALRPLESMLKKGVNLRGLIWIWQLLRLSLEARSKKRRGEPDLEKLVEPAKKLVFPAPVMILAGGCGNMNDVELERLGILKDSLRDWHGTIISGGTYSGIAKIPGDLQEEASSKKLVTIGYIPGEIPRDEKVDKRYKKHRRTQGKDFSVVEPLAFWRDFLAAGGVPGNVRMIGYNGGKIAGCEFRIALAMGARVGIIKGSGREADAILGDPLSDQSGDGSHPEALRLDPSAIRRFLDLEP